MHQDPVDVAESRRIVAEHGACQDIPSRTVGPGSVQVGHFRQHAGRRPGEQPRQRGHRLGCLVRGRATEVTMIYQEGSERELIERFGTTKSTAGKAIALLQAEGLVRTETGRGTFVQDIPKVKRVRRIPPRGHGSGSSFAEEMRKAGLTPSTKLVQAEAGIPPADVAGRLELGDDEQALIRKRHMFTDGRPARLAVSYTLWCRFRCALACWLPCSNLQVDLSLTAFTEDINISQRPGSALNAKGFIEINDVVPTCYGI
jgi:Bacterial regulatory proteins, gntR family